MSKLKRDIASWSRRVMMSKSRLWVVVEGTSVDAPFYEGVIAESVELESVQIIEAEDIEIDGTSAGGKASALKAFRYFENEGTLRQTNRSTTVDWLFALDRDDDDFTDAVIDSPHVIYTHHADVEAEVMVNTDLERAVATAYSLPVAVVRTVNLGSPASRLAEIWSHWIWLRLASCACGLGSARFAQQSQVHKPLYGELHVGLSTSIVDRAKASVGDAVWASQASDAESFLEARRAENEGARSVKGKWIPNYVSHLVQTALGETHELPRVSTQHLLSVSVARLDFSGEWAQRYRTHLQALLAA